MKIAFFEIQGWEKPFVRKALKGHQVEFFSDELNIENADQFKDFDAISVFIYSEVDKRVIKKMPKLKLITTRSTGFDHIDIDFCKKKKITVANVPFYGENTVAEHTFALILALSRNVHKSYLRTLQNDFSITGLRGFDLKGKTIGIIGAGHIGLHVVRIAKGFGMEALVHDLNQNNFISEVLDFEYASMDDLIKKSDIISLHLPYNEKTHHLINKDRLSKMKKGVIIINTARGGIIDTDALLAALENGTVAGAGLDVLEGEELIREEKELLYDKQNVESLKSLVRDRILLNKDNVVFTPHIAFYSKEALQRIIETTVQNILEFETGTPQYQV